jgi:CheY-like chemotaxis protein
MKVLVVDDDRDTIELMKAVGGHAGVEMIAFTTGLDALKYLEDNEVDVAVLDLEMPVLDGLRLAKEIRKNEELHPGKRPVQLVFATGHEIGDTIERVGNRVGVQKRYMIHKPFDVCGLMNELKKDFEYSS